MDVILRTSSRSSRIMKCIPMIVIVPKPEYTVEEWKGNAKLREKLERLQMAAANKILACSRTTSNRALKIDLGM